MVFHFTTFINTVLKLNKLDYIVVVQLVAILSVKKIYVKNNYADNKITSIIAETSHFKGEFLTTAKCRLTVH